MTLFFPEEKDPTDFDFYEAEVDSDWRGGETIAAVDFSPADDSGLTLANVGYLGNVVRAQLGGGVTGTHAIEITVTTSTGRVRQRTVFLVVREK